MRRAVSKSERTIVAAIACCLAACSAAPPAENLPAEDERADALLAPRGGRFFTQTLVQRETEIRDIAVDDRSVYYVSAAVPDPNQPRNTTGRAAAVSKFGGFLRVIAPALKGGGSIAVNGFSVFFTGAVETGSGLTPAIFTQSKFGGRVTRFAPSFPGTIPGIFPGNAPEQPPFLLADDRQLYAVGDLAIFYRIPFADQKPIALVQSADHVSIAQSAREAFVSEGRNCSGFIAEIRKDAPGDIGSSVAPSPFASFIADESRICFVWSMAVSGSTLYWNSIFDGLFAAHLNGAPAAPGVPTLLLSPDPNDLDHSPRFLAVVPPNLYFTTADGALKSIPQAGGAVNTVVAGGVNPNVRIAADANSIYWVSTNADQVRRTRVR